MVSIQPRWMVGLMMISLVTGLSAAARTIRPPRIEPLPF